MIMKNNDNIVTSKYALSYKRHTKLKSSWITEIPSPWEDFFLVFFSWEIYSDFATVATAKILIKLLPPHINNIQNNIIVFLYQSLPL